MSLVDLEKKISETKNKPNPHIPTQEEIYQAQIWVIENFPYSVTPSYNPGVAKDIQKWLDENIGPMDDKWTWMDREIRFRFKEDYVLYGMTWQKFEKENVL